MPEDGPVVAVECLLLVSGFLIIFGKLVENLGLVVVCLYKALPHLYLVLLISLYLIGFCKSPEDIWTLVEGEDLVSEIEDLIPLAVMEILVKYAEYEAVIHRMLSKNGAQVTGDEGRLYVFIRSVLCAQLPEVRLFLRGLYFLNGCLCILKVSELYVCSVCCVP